jgi:hypothetical protein
LGAAGAERVRQHFSTRRMVEQVQEGYDRILRAGDMSDRAAVT